MKPLAIDLYCGLGGWTEGLLAQGWNVVGFDIERHEYGDHKYPAQLVLQDVFTIHGKQFAGADLIVASPPCQFFSYCAMPWSRAKALAAEVRANPVRLEKELALFRACFRIQREACEAAGRHIPMVVENVRGAEAWVGPAAAKYGSFYFWGDLPALMPVTKRAQKNGHLDGGSWFNIGGPGQKVVSMNPDGRKTPGFRFDGSGRSFQSEAVAQHGVKTVGHVNKRDGYSHTRHLTNQAESAGVKIGGDWFSDSQSTCRRHSSKSNARKAASAMIAKIPEPLARWIANAWRPEEHR